VVAPFQTAGRATSTYTITWLGLSFRDVVPSRANESLTTLRGFKQVEPVSSPPTTQLHRALPHRAPRLCLCRPSCPFHQTWFCIGYNPQATSRPAFRHAGLCHARFVPARQLDTPIRTTKVLHRSCSPGANVRTARAVTRPPAFADGPPLGSGAATRPRLSSVKVREASAIEDSVESNASWAADLQRC